MFPRCWEGENHLRSINIGLLNKTAPASAWAVFSWREDGRIRVFFSRQGHDSGQKKNRPWISPRTAHETQGSMVTLGKFRAVTFTGAFG